MIYIAGSLNVDMCIESPYMPKAGETITGGGFLVNGGGKGANQAVAAGKLGGKVKMCGVVGDDAFGDMLIGNLKNAGVDVGNIEKKQGVSTGVAVIVLSDGDNRIILDKGANACLTEWNIDKFLAEAKVGDIYLTQLENPVGIIGYGLEKAKEKGMITVLNPAPANKEIMPYLKFVDIITPNETECEIFGGKEALLAAGIKSLVITLGKDGYEIADKNGSKKYSCMKVKAVDTTAAGDTFCGGLVTMLSENKTLDKACAFGSKAASIACTKKGAQQSVPSRSEVENY